MTNTGFLVIAYGGFNTEDRPNPEPGTATVYGPYSSREEAESVACLLWETPTPEFTSTEAKIVDLSEQGASLNVREWLKEQAEWAFWDGDVEVTSPEDWLLQIVPCEWWRSEEYKKEIAGLYAKALDKLLPDWRSVVEDLYTESEASQHA